MRQNMISFLAFLFCCALAVVAARLNKWPVHLILVPVVAVFLLTKKMNSGGTRQ